MRFFVFVPLAALALSACRPSGGDAPAPAASADTTLAAVDSATTRVVTLGGAVTETVFALGAGDAVVAVDASSVYPAAAAARPKVGYFRTLGAEALLATRPTLVLAADGAGPPPTLAQLRQAGANVVATSGGASVDSVAAMIRQVAGALGREAAGQRLVDTLRAQVARAEAAGASLAARPRVVFVQAQERGAFGLAGDDTNAGLLLQMAGATNAVQGFTGYRPVTAEALAAARPDVVVVTGRTLGMAGGPEALLAQGGLAATPAAQTRHLVVLDDADLNPGPRVGEAALKLHGLLLDPAKAAAALRAAAARPPMREDATGRPGAARPAR